LDTGFIRYGDLQLQQITVTENILTLALVASHFDDSLRALTSEANRRRLTPKADGRGLTLFIAFPFLALARPDRKPARPTVGC
jgi:hypothetical protein